MSSSITYKIKELDPDMIAPSTRRMNEPEQGGSKIVVIGKPGTGKSTTISSLLYEKSHIFPVGIVMSGSEVANHHYSANMFPSSFVFNTLDTGKLNEFLKRQEIAKKQLPNPWCAVVLDDCLDEPKLINNEPTISHMFKLGRHDKMLFIMGIQYAMDIKPSLRQCVDFAFLLKESNLKTRKCLFENYGGLIGDFTVFCELMDQLTNDYMALVINNTTTSNKIEDQVFWYKAKPVPKNFKFGCPEFWAYHKERFETGTEDK